jgi:hypothetical protein
MADRSPAAPASAARHLDDLHAIRHACQLEVFAGDTRVLRPILERDQFAAVARARQPMPL